MVNDFHEIYIRFSVITTREIRNRLRSLKFLSDIINIQIQYKFKNF